MVLLISTALIAVVNLVLPSPQRLRNKVSLAEKEQCCLFTEQEVKTVYPGILKENTAAYQSLAQRLRAMLRTYCRKLQLTATSHPSTSTNSLRIWGRDNYEQHFTTELVPITVGRGKSFVDQFNLCCRREQTVHKGMVVW